MRHTVWVVERNIDYEGAQVIGVFDTCFGAQRLSDSQNEENLFDFIEYTYTQWDVQEIS